MADEYELRICHGWPEGSCTNVEDYEVTLTTRGKRGEEASATIPICASCAERMIEALTGAPVERHGEGPDA